MRKRYRRNKLYIIVFLVIMSSIGVGYAALTSTITINGTTQITSAKWYVHFENYTLGANTSENYSQPLITDNGTKLMLDYQDLLSLTILQLNKNI